MAVKQIVSEHIYCSGVIDTFSKAAWSSLTCR